MNRYHDYSSQPIPDSNTTKLSGNGCGDHAAAADCLNRRPVSLMAWPFIATIYFYRYSVGHWFSGYCRFYPSCSHYGEEALKKHGALRGSMLIVKRLLRCNPWSDGGYDPVR